MQISQYCYFCIRSTDVPATDIAAGLGIQPDEVLVRGSKRSAPRVIPVQHAWRVVCREPGLGASEQIESILARLVPETDRPAQYLDELRESGCDVATTLQVVRNCNHDDGEDENLAEVTVGSRTLVKLSGQHQLLGWHLDRRALDFLQRTGAELDVDEYG